MKLLTIFKDLSYSELKQLDIGHFFPDEFESEPDPKVYAQLISLINRAMSELYKRFLLSAKEIIIEQDTSVEEYLLTKDYSQTNTASAIPLADRFIADSVANPFLDDILKIEEVYDEAGNKLYLNDNSEDLSIFTPTWRSVQIPYPNEFDSLAIQYRADFTDIVWSVAIDPATTEVALPNALRESLMLYVGYLAFASLNTDGGNTEGADFKQRYEDSLLKVSESGLHVVDNRDNSWRFDTRGWV